MTIRANGPRRMRSGDAKYIRAALASTPAALVEVVLSPPISEAHAFDGLAAMSRGNLLLLLRDEWEWMDAGSSAWLEGGLRLLEKRGVRAGVIGFAEAVHGLRCSATLRCSKG